MRLLEVYVAAVCWTVVVSLGLCLCWYLVGCLWGLAVLGSARLSDMAQGCGCHVVFCLRLRLFVMWSVWLSWLRGGFLVTECDCLSWRAVLCRHTDPRGAFFFLTNILSHWDFSVRS